MDARLNLFTSPAAGKLMKHLVMADKVVGESPLPAKHFDEEQLVALVGGLAVINAFNWLNVITQQPAGDYVVGQFG